MKRIAFIIHGRIAVNLKLIRNIEDVLNGYEYKFFVTKHSNHATELTKQAIADGYNYIICVGGDGSLNEVVNGIMRTPKGDKEVYIGLLPYGTGNDFAKTLHISQRVEDLKKCIDKHSYKAIDCGHVGYTEGDNSKGSRFFINITDVGLGGIAAERINGYPRWLPAVVAYQLAIVSTLFTYKKKKMQAEADTFKYYGTAMNIIVANGKYFGSGLGIAPHAEPNDGKLAVVLAANISLWDYLINIGTVRKCEKVNHEQMHYYTANKITVSGEVPMAIDMDGEFIGYSPMHINIVPGVLNFLCSA